MRELRRVIIWSVAGATTLLVGTLALSWQLMINMPGVSHRGPLPPLTNAQRELASELKTHVTHLASEVGKRSIYHPKELAAAALYLKTELESYGYEVKDHSFPTKGAGTPNLEATLPGTHATLASEIIVIGAHYDTTQRSPGADDNASG
ncbi:MAG: M28 family peptidase, partial [Phycisphaerae bacterium]